MWIDQLHDWSIGGEDTFAQYFICWMPMWDPGVMILKRPLVTLASSVICLSYPTSLFHRLQIPSLKSLLMFPWVEFFVQPKIKRYPCVSCSEKMWEDKGLSNLRRYPNWVESGDIHQNVDKRVYLDLKTHFGQTRWDILPNFRVFKSDIHYLIKLPRENLINHCERCPCKTTMVWIINVSSSPSRFRVAIPMSLCVSSLHLFLDNGTEIW